MNWKLFFSTYLLVFVAELPDKTALATVLLAARGNPYATFVGVAAAFVVQSLVAVLFGSLIGLLPAHWVRLGAGIMFIVFAAMAWRRRNEPSEDSRPPQEGWAAFGKTAWAAFAVIFIAEWGDLTQLATASLAAKYAEPVTLFISATLALWTVTALAIVVGTRAKESLNPKVLNAIGAVLFAAVGSYFVLESLIHSNL